MHRMLIGMLMASMLGGCASAAIPVAPATPDVANPVAVEPPSVAAVAATDGPSRRSGAWIGAAGASEYVLAGSSDTSLGVWVDVPAAASRAHAPAAIALVIDTSGSMAGPKMDNARVAARALIDKLPDGDIVSIHTFADDAHERVRPTILTASTRLEIHRVIAGLQPVGGTNLFDGLRLGEGRVQASPATHPVRRVIVISDGIANIGPSSPELLGALAARGADAGTQVTALGVGLDYDERTLNALAVRSSGRLYHLAEPREMASILDREIGLLRATVATNAVVEIVPAPGVVIHGADGIRADRGANGALLVPLGTMYGGQHREMLVRVRVHAQGDGSRPLASVRFRFRDPTDGNVERVQEVVARYQVTTDRLAIEAHAHAKTRAIAATFEASRAALAAAQQVNEGRFEAADKDLAEAEAKLRASAARMKNDVDRQRVMANATRISTVRNAAKAAAGAPPAAAPAAKRARALDINAAAVKAAGF